MGLVSKIQLNVQAQLLTPLDLADATANLNKTYLLNLASGFAAGQADRVFHDNRTLAPSTAEDLDLAGALLDPLGGAFAPVRIKAIMVRAGITNVNNVIIGGVANAWATLLSPAATGLLTLRPGALFLAMAGGVQSGEAGDATGYTVTPATGDLLHIANSGAGTSVNYDVVLIGCSA